MKERLQESQGVCVWRLLICEGDMEKKGCEVKERLQESQGVCVRRLLIWEGAMEK